MDTYQISFWCFSNLCSLFYYLFLMYCISNTLAPEKTQTFLIDAGWASIKLYHILKLKSEKFVKQRLQYYFGDEYKHLFNKSNPFELERSYYVKNGQETTTLQKDAEMVLTFFHNLKSEENQTPVLITKEADSFSTALIENKYCTFKFIGISLTNKNNEIDINLFKPYNFYLEGNVILDEVFLKWYCKRFYNVELESDYKLRIIDDNANFLNLDKNNMLLLNKNDYELISGGCSNTTTDTDIGTNSIINSIENKNENEIEIEPIDNETVDSNNDNDNHNNNYNDNDDNTNLGIRQRKII